MVAQNHAIRKVVQSEIGWGGFASYPGLALCAQYLYKIGKPIVYALCCHTAIESLGIPISYSDRYQGQKYNGKFVETTQVISKKLQDN
jgi:hypothetical protein